MGRNFIWSTMAAMALVAGSAFAHAPAAHAATIDCPGVPSNDIYLIADEDAKICAQMTPSNRDIENGMWLFGGYTPNIGSTLSVVFARQSNAGFEGLTPVCESGNCSIYEGEGIAGLCHSGICTISASYTDRNGDSVVGRLTVNADSTPRVQSATVTGKIFSPAGVKLSQTITFAKPANQSLSATPLALTATATSGLAVSFSSTTTSVCTVSGNNVTLRAIGTCTIEATQAGNSTYDAATPVRQSFTISPAGPSAELGTIPTLTVGTSASFTPVVGSGGTGPLTYSISPALPAGLSFSSTDGKITGTPTAAQPATTYTVIVASMGLSVSKAFELTVEDVPQPLIVTTAIASKKLAKNEPVTPFKPVTASGGTLPYDFSVSPDLPAGLEMEEDTGEITGTPTELSAEKTYTVTVADNPSTSTSISQTSSRPSAPSPTLSATFKLSVVDDTTSDDPTVTEEDLVPQVETQVRDSIRLVGVQNMNIWQRLNTIRSGNVSGFSSTGFALTQDRGDGLAYVQSAQAQREAEKQPYGQAAEPRETDILQITPTASAAPVPGDTARPPLAGWINGNVVFGKQDNFESGTRSRDGFTTAGVTIGADYAHSETLTLGFALGYGEAKADIGTNGSENQSQMVSLMAYGNLKTGDTSFVDMVAGYGFGNFDLKRWSTTGSTLLTGDRDADQLFGSIRFSQVLEQDNGLQIIPSMRLEALRMNLNAYDEVGAAASALSYESMNVSSLAAVPGIRAQWERKEDWGTLTPSVKLEYRRSFLGGYRQNLSFVSGGATYGLEEDSEAKSSILLGLGLTAFAKDGWTLDVGYDFTADVSGPDDIISHGISATYRQEF